MDERENDRNGTRLTNILFFLFANIFSLQYDPATGKKLSRGTWVGLFYYLMKTLKLYVMRP
jgi:hypothetical protein